MRRIALLTLMFSLLASAPVDALDAQGPVLCALVDVYDCSTDECREVSSEAVAVPDLLRLDPEKKTATALDIEFEGVSAPLDSMTAEDGRVVAHGAFGERLLVVSIEADSGDGILTFTDPKTTLVMFAECIEP